MAHIVLDGLDFNETASTTTTTPQKKPNTIRDQITNYALSDGVGPSTIRGLMESAGRTIALGVGVADKAANAFGYEVMPEIKQNIGSRLDLLEQKKESVADTVRSPERKAEVEAMQKKAKDASGFVENAKAGVENIVDTLVHPKEWTTQGVVSTVIDLTNLLSFGVGSLTAKIAAKALPTLERNIAARAGVGSLGGAGEGAAQGFVIGAGVAKGRGKSDEEALKEGIQNMVGGAAIGAPLGGLGGAVSRTSAVGEKIDAPAGQSEATPDILNNPLLDTEAMNGVLKKSFAIVEEAEKDGEKNAAQRASIVNKLTAKGMDTSTAKGRAEEIVPPTENELHLTSLWNDENVDIPASLQGTGLSRALSVNIGKAIHTTDEFAVVISKYPLAEDIKAAAIDAYDKKDIAHFDDYLATKIADKKTPEMESYLAEHEMTRQIELDTAHHYADALIDARAKAAGVSKEEWQALHQLETFDNPNATKAQMDAEANALFELKMGANREATIDDVKESLALHPGRYEHTPYSRDVWDKMFPNNKIDTPLGEIKLGDSQFEKLDPTIPDPKNPNRKKEDRRGQLSYIYQTLKEPAFAIEKKDGSKLYLKEFERDGKQPKQYASILIIDGGMDIGVSNHGISYKQILNEAREGKVSYMSPKVAANEAALAVSHPTSGIAGNDILHQRLPESQENVVNGLYMQMGEKHIIETFKTADFATVMHEYGHYFRRTLGEMERMIAEKAFGVERGEWTTVHEERFANAFVKWLSSGKAPTAELAAVFGRMQAFLQELFSRIKGSREAAHSISAKESEFFAAIFGDKEAAAAIYKDTLKNRALSIAEEYKKPKAKSMKEKIADVKAEFSDKIGNFDEREYNAAMQKAMQKSIHGDDFVPSVTKEEAAKIKDGEADEKLLKKLDNDAKELDAWETRNGTINTIKDGADDSRSGDTERYSGEGADERTGQDALFVGRDGMGEAGSVDGASDGARGVRGEDNNGVSDDSALAGGERGDKQVYSQNGDAGATKRPAGGDDAARGGADSADGISTERRGESGNGGVDETTTDSGRSLDGGSETGKNKIDAGDGEGTSRDISIEERRALQKEAEYIPVTLNDKDNIAATLPMLLKDQHDDVFVAEKRFFEDDGRGILFTNGTGTGKTYTGLGIAKRYERRGKNNILFVVPSDQKIKDWIGDGENVNLKLRRIESTKDGESGGKVITTYANFRQNEALQSATWDLIVYDESHNILQDKDGKPGQTLRAHQKAALSADNAYQKARDMIDASGKERTPELVAKTAEEILQEAPQVVFLSASPFASHKALVYGDGFIFNSSAHDNGKATSYNNGDGFERMMIESFGYSMRYNKLTTPDSKIDVGLMERRFADNLKKSGAMSGRTLKLDYDYQRHFLLVEDGIGRKIDDGMEAARDHKKYKHLPELVRLRHDFLYTNRLMEAMKAKAMVPVVEESMAMGKKVVVFHNYNEGLPAHPFDFRSLVNTYASKRDPLDPSATAREAFAEIEKFNAEHPEYIKMDLSELSNPISTLTTAFGEKAVLFNGNVSPKTRSANIKAFNADETGPMVLVVQADAGGTGISLHDQTGVHQRVSISLGLPYKPINAIQIEGRTYRVGQKSDAPMVYPVLHLGFERHAFGSKINARVGTVENLALGSEARALKERFKDGYLGAESLSAKELDGLGGKQLDRNTETIDAFDMAISDYYSNQKKTSKTKSAEGKDYYATPEPIGFKMVEWANIKNGEDVLEPSAGHGAIARYMPELSTKTFVEPSRELSGRLAVNADGHIINGAFEELHISNKYDTIVMNPPYGTGGKTAMEHLAKAAVHLRQNGRIVALLPEGAAFEKRLDAWKESKESNGIYEVARVSLPSGAFDRAGTGVKTQIIILDKSDGVEYPRSVDLSAYKNTKELFDALREMDMPRRAGAVPEIAMDEAVGIQKPDSGLKLAMRGTKTDSPFAVVSLTKKLRRDEFNALYARAKVEGGQYNRHLGGIVFDDVAAAKNFMRSEEC